MNTQLKKEITAMADYLWSNEYEGKVIFDHNSYDDDRDIPHLFIGGNRILINTFEISRDANKLSIISGDDKFSIDTDYLIYQMENNVGERIGLFGLLRDVYYETSQSWEIGDYELDFLKERN